jgi:hypothetical protein
MQTHSELLSINFGAEHHCPLFRPRSLLTCLRTHANTYIRVSEFPRDAVARSALFSTRPYLLFAVFDESQRSAKATGAQTDASDIVVCDFAFVLFLLPSLLACQSDLSLSHAYTLAPAACS